MTLSFLLEDQDYSYGEQSYKVAPLREMSEEARREFFAHLALKHCKKIGNRTRIRLLRYYKSAFTAIENRKNWREASVNKDCVSEYAKEAWRAFAEKEWNEAAKSEASILLWNSSAYPSRLREIVDPPSYLYCLGDLSLLDAPMLAIVGSRKASSSGQDIAFNISRDLAAGGITVVSGMAQGIDRYAHKAAIFELGRSVGVLGTGINLSYPHINKDIYPLMREYGLLLSEFSPNLPPAGVNFPIRNRIISGLSLGILVVEAAERSGSLITAQYALEQNREVFAIPGQALNNHSMGCQNLIRQGAHSVFCVDDILRELGELLKTFRYEKPNQTNILDVPSLPDIESSKQDDETAFEEKDLVEKCCQGDLSDRIVQCLKKRSMHIEELVDELQENLDEVNSKLVFLELLGRIRRLPGARFESI